MTRKLKTILITGAGSGIGLDTAFVLLQRGHTVIATTETEDQALALRTRAGGADRMIICTLDVTREEDRKKINNYNIDVLINNAAIGESGSLAEVPMDRIRRSFDVNVFGPLALTQLALKDMVQKNVGTVIFISSLAGRTVTSFLNPYSMTKHALSGGLAATRAEIHRVANNVHITLVEPGAYHTGFNQRMVATKYQWMHDDSYFSNIIATLQKEDVQSFGFLEVKNTTSIVRKIVKAAEADRPRLRYVAPWWQGFGVALLRLFGR